MDTSIANFQESPEEFIINLLLTQKKLSKSQLLALNITEIVENVMLKEIDFKKSSLILLSLSKLIARLYITLHGDCEAFLKTISMVSSSAKPALKKHSMKPITLEIIEPEFYVNDEMIQRDEELLFPEELRGDLSLGMDTGMFEPEFEAIPSIELARDGTLISEPPNIQELAVKRRKLIEDRITEISKDLYKSYLRSTAGIITKTLPKGIIPSSKISIDPKILSVFKEESKKIQIEPEIQRFDTTVFEPEFSFEPAFEIPIEEKLIISEPESIFRNFDLPQEFIFNDFISTFSKKSKVESFYDLLIKTSRNEIIASQLDPYANIICTSVQGT